jgi:hypothetical protein
VSVSESRVRKSIFEKNTKCKSETLGFWDFIRVNLSVCIIFFNNIQYDVFVDVLDLGNHANLLVCIFLCLLFIQYAQ